MSSQLTFDNTKEVFSLDKEILSFNIDINNISELEPIKSSINSETEVKITNLTNDYIAFRTKTTKKIYYTVQPSQCVIPPKEIKNIKISFYLKEGEKPKWHGHKFRFEGFVIQSNEKDMEPKNIFSEYTKKGVPVVGDSQKTFVQFLDTENSAEKTQSKSRNFLKLPQASHARSGSDLSEYMVTDEINEIKNENDKKDLLMDKIISNDEQKKTLSEMITTGENKEENNNEMNKNEKKENELKNDNNKNEEKENVFDNVNVEEKEKNEELNTISNIITSTNIKDDKIEKEIKDKESKENKENPENEEKKEISDNKEKGKIEELKKEEVKSNENENKNVFEKSISNKQVINNIYFENTQNVSDINVIIALFIIMVIGYLLV